MLVHPQFDPVAFQLGPLAIRWYGLMYLIGFVLFLVLGRLRSRDAWRDMSAQDVDDLLFYGMIGRIVGGRLGHVLFYGPLSYYLANPLDIFAVWKGGMASHGGIIGVIVAMALFARARRKSFLRVADFVAARRRQDRALTETSRLTTCAAGTAASRPRQTFPKPVDDDRTIIDDRATTTDKNKPQRLTRFS